MNHVANAACVLCIASYVRTNGWLIISLKKITGDFFQTLEVNADL